MAIKLKNKIKLESCAFLISLLLLAILSISVYPIIEELGRLSIRSNQVNYLESKSFYFKVFGEIENLYSQHIKTIRFEDKHSLANYQLNTNKYRQAELSYNREVLYNKPSKNISYAILDKETGKWATNLNAGQKEKIGLKNNKKIAISEYYLKQLEQEFNYLWLIEIDERGQLETLYTSSGITYDNTLYESFCNTYSIKPIQNVQLLYTIPSEFIQQDKLYTELEQAKYRGYQKYVIGLGSLGIVLMGGLGAFFRYEKFNRGSLRDKYNGLCLEKKLFICLIGLICFNVYIKLSTVLITEGKGITNVYNIEISSELACWILVINCILTTFIYYLIAYLIGGNLRYIHKLGLKEGVFKYSWCAKHYSKIKTILKEPYKRMNLEYIVFSLIGINMVLSMAIGNIGNWGVVLCLLYNGILFVVSRQVINWIRVSFGELTQVTDEIKKGNLDIGIQKNLGVFNVLAENLIEVKEGFKQAVEKEVKSERMKTELITNISHDLKTPLTSIINYIDLLKMSDLEKDMREQYINILENKSKRLQVLIEDLFEMSKAASGNIQLELQELDIVALMNQIIGELRDKIDKSGLIFKTKFPDTKVKVILDGKCMVRVIENLISNTIKYALVGSRVFIEIIENEESIVIIIKNISAEEIHFTAEDIIERFSRGDTSRHTEGSGLGLAISKSLIELQGGKFEVSLDGDLFKVIIKLIK